jgi:HTH-type transcriptional regulator / antitoxin HigA
VVRPLLAERIRQPRQRAWAFRVRQLAEAIPGASVARFSDARIPALKADLRKLAAYSKEVRKAPALLLSYGIRFVVVEGLSGAKMDGFATWIDADYQQPVIGMSLRYDRLDSFWFTLGHEVSHIAHHDIAPVDGDVSGQEDLLEVKPPMERRADEESAATFIDPVELQSFIRRHGPRYSADHINQFANRIKMHPNIIVGQLKNRGEIKYSQHTKTIVPVRELVVKAAVTDGWGKDITLGGNP